VGTVAEGEEPWARVQTCSFGSLPVLALTFGAVPSNDPLEAVMPVLVVGGVDKKLHILSWVGDAVAAPNWTGGASRLAPRAHYGTSCTASPVTFCSL
jgi:hypothetical protein